MGHRMAATDRKTLIKLLEKNGWYVVKSNRGSHVQMKNYKIGGKITVPLKITKNIELSVLSRAGLRGNIYSSQK